MGNFVQDSACTNYEDSVVLFRNVWPYLEPTDSEVIAKNLAKNSNNNTTFVLGDFDKNPLSLSDGKEVSINGLLFAGGFSEFKPNLFRKISNAEGVLTTQSWLKFFHDSIRLDFYQKYYSLKSSIFGNM